MSDPVAVEILSRFEKAKSNRLNWESYWQEVSEYVMPNMSNTFFEGGYPLAKAQKRDRKRVDGSAEIALDRHTSAMESMLTPRNARWHTISTDNHELNKIRAVRDYFDLATDVLFKYRYSSKANFSSQIYEHYQSLGAFGTGATYIDKLTPRGFRYAHIHIAQVYFYENHQGQIDEAMRGPIKISARNALAQFTDVNGSNSLPDEIVKAASEEPHTMFDFIHCVKPNDDIDASKKDYRGMPFISYYVSIKHNVTVLVEGFNTFPYVISRYVTAPGEVYGRSPAMKALSNIKVLNEQKKTILKQGHRAVDPVLLAHDDGVLDSFSLRPGAINTGAMSSDGKRLVDVLPTGNISVGDAMMNIEREEIAAAFMTDLFQIFMDRPQMTATEVTELAREKGILLSPIMGRQESEFLGPMIEREMDLAAMQGLLPPPPQELIDAGGEYTIVFDSPLSRAQKAEAAAGLMRTVGWAAEIAGITQNPEPLDHFNWDAIIPELSMIQAVPGRWMATAEQLQAIRGGREQAASMQQVIEAGPTIAAITKQQRQ